LKNLNRKGYGVATIGATLMYVCNGKIISVLSMGIELSRGRIEIQLTGLTPLEVLACPKPEPGFPKTYVVAFFSSVMI
jgi:hypothetical protein